MNELYLETSPYLLQHANNPVHWRAWNEISLTLAKKENKLILISIGYSSCHWCHVMEHESFEDQEVAKVMNKNFINIKIDREEHPDVDAIYMKAVQVMTGRGGWPLNVITLPDGRPIWGGTYFKKKDWINSLEKLQELYTNQPETIFEYAQKLHDGLHSLSVFPISEDVKDFTISTLIPLVEKWERSFDWNFGGMAKAPKFMMPNNLEFLMRYGYQTKNQSVLDFVYLTLTKMAFGGIFDPLAGGFSRYSVDIKWHIPHFEKMLYDNGQMVSLYANAYKLSQKELYKDVVEKTLCFVEQEWLNPEGGFYSAFDADSLNSENQLEEGAFYTWTSSELQEILQDDFTLFSRVFNINDFGYWEKDNYVLIQNQELTAIAESFSIPLNILIQKKKDWEQKLYQKREERNKPRLDDKCLTSWNAIMLKGFIDAYKALGNKRYLKIAIQNATFIETKLWNPEGNLFRTYKNNKASINGYLEDYAHVIKGFISLYQVTLDESWLQKSKQLTDYCFDNFYNEKQQFFDFTSTKDSKLIIPNFETEDNVIPSANSVMAENLFLLGTFFENEYYNRIGQQMVENIIPTIDYPSAYSNWMNVFLNYLDSNQELAICGDNAVEKAIEIHREYLPNVLIAGTTQDSSIPFLKNRFHENETLFYLCQNKTCQPPISSIKKILKLAKQ